MSISRRCTITNEGAHLQTHLYIRIGTHGPLNTFIITYMYVPEPKLAGTEEKDVLYWEPD